MSEKIIAIDEVEDVCVNGYLEKFNNGNGIVIKSCNGAMKRLFGYQKFDGYKIVTYKNIYMVLIENGQCCCEDWGYFSSNDDIQSYVGKELSEVRLTDVARNIKKIEELDLSSMYNHSFLCEAGDIIFVDFVMTDGNVLQLAVYNAHNGFYGHDILVLKNQEVLKSDCI